MLKSAWQSLSTLLLQQVCPLCDRPTPEAVCPRCWQKIASSGPADPPGKAMDGLPVVAWRSYQGALKQAIAALKYNGNLRLAMPLGHALGQHWQASPISTRYPPIVVPIPLHPEKLQARGFNQAELLAIPFCQQTGLKYVPQGLIRQRATIPQFTLGLAEREQNLAGAFALGSAFCRSFPKRPVLLLDDIYTTGTTVRTAAAELRRHRISVCGVVALARTPFGS